MTNYLSSIDFGLIFVYFAILLLIGYLVSRKQQDEDFLIAKRGLGTWSTMATINASKSGSILMTFVAMSYIWGISAVWYFVGVIVGIVLFIPFAVKLKKYSQQKYYTLADYFKYNYGKRPAIFASILSIFLMFGLGVLNMIAGAKIFVFFSGWPFWFCAILMTLVILTYLMLGGFKAVAKTDILQYAAMIFILVILAFSLFDGSIISSSDWNLFSIDLTSVIGFFLVGIIYPFASPDLWQRIYSAKGSKELKRGLILSNFFYGLMAFMLALVALTVKARFPEIDPDMALIHGFSNLLPTGLVGLSLVLLFAAIMSSLDTYIFTGSSAIIQDFFDWDKKIIIKNIKKVILVFSIVGTVLAIAIKSLIIGAYIFAAFYSTLAVPVIASWIKRKISRVSLFYGFLFGVIGVVVFLVVSLLGKGVTPVVVLVSICAGVLGLLFGGLVAKLRK